MNVFMKRSTRKSQQTTSRILDAARALFEARGYEATTIRDIAEAADVGVGTVMLRGGDKQALLQAVWRRDTMPVVEGAIASVRSPCGELVDEVMALFEPLIMHYATQPSLARVVISALPTLQGEAMVAHRADLMRLLDALCVVIVRAQGAQRLVADVPPMQLAQLLFTLYYGALMAMVSPLSSASPQAASASLRAQLALLQRGIGASS